MESYGQLEQRFSAEAMIIEFRLDGRHRSCFSEADLQAYLQWGEKMRWIGSAASFQA